MSFLSDVKTELAEVIPDKKHCVLAQAEARKYFTLIQKPYKIKIGVLERRCCKRAFLREAFLIAGAMSDPSKSYHFEIVCSCRDKAEFLKELIEGFDGMLPKIIKRGSGYVVYLKGSDQIVDMLGIMEAPNSLMELENIRILKEMRNDVNRRVNFETANLNKTVSAAVKQINDIRFIEELIGLPKLPEGLETIARLRLENPDSTLEELGLLLSPPVGKSGVNHRLRKISQIAEKLREET